MYDSIVFGISDENILYFNFFGEKKLFNRKFELLNPLVDYFPKDDPFHEKARKKYIGIQKEFMADIDKIVENNPDKFVSKLIALQKPPFLDPDLPDYERFEYLKAHYFDGRDFSDISLIYTNAYPGLAIDYMSLYSGRNLSQDELEDQLIIAVDEIMYRALDNDIVYEFVVEYLVGGFEKYHFDKVLDHIAQSYTPEQCENEERKSDLKTRLEKYAELAVGKTAPGINIKSLDGTKIKLDEINKEYTLIFFWASWCPHCDEVMPKIHTLYSEQKNKNLEILAVSLDSEKAEWEKALEGKNYSWINVSNLEGWNGNA
ncbi:MAG: redoxin domain-containing protein, partial [Bacteroidales bacterium]|nr:redoxin domain-containing protein [Bacteroidales bacterium]